MQSKWIARGISACAVAASLAASAIQYTDALPVVLGEWNTNFEEAKAIADAQHIPMVLFWGGASCSICRNVEICMDDQEVLDWQAERKLLMVFQSGTSGAMKDFTMNSSGTYPYLCVYWNRGDGTATTNRFSGVISGSSRWPATGTTTAEHFIKSVELYIADYQPAQHYSGRFACGDADGNRLEAVVGKTKTLYVPLKRDAASAPFAATNYLVTVYGEQAGLAPVTNTVAWAGGEAEKLAGVAIPAKGDFRAGDMAALDLLDSEQLQVDEIHVKFVKEPANCPSNPDWIGEKFEFGRWTFDYEAAKKAGGYTLVLYTGAMWCPYCKGIEGSLFAPGSEFYSWAASKKVALVEFDQGRASTPATAEGTRAPRLLTYDVGTDNNKKDASGAGYLSRHEIQREEAEAKLAETTYYTKKWLAPEATAARLSQPTLLLVKNDEVIARFTAYRDSNKDYDVKENIGRLNDFLKLWDGEGEKRGYRTTTERVCRAGESASATVQISARNVYFKVPGLPAGRFTVSRTDNGANPVVFSLLQGKTTLATGTDSLEAEIDGETAAKGDFTLNVNGYSNTSKLFFNPEDGEPVATTEFTVSFATGSVLVPEEAAVAFTPAGDTLQMTVEEGVAYRFSGVTEASLAANFAAGENGTWIAKASADVALKVTTAGETVRYQKWRPGEFAFVDPADLKLEETAGVVEIAVNRFNGVSGDSSVKVTVDDAGVTKGRYQLGLLDEKGEFTECAPVLAWADGEAEAKAFAVKIVNDSVHDGDQTMTFGLVTESGETGIAAEGAVKKVILADDDVPGPGKLAIAEVVPAAARASTVYAAAGTKVVLRVARERGADGEAGATLAAKLDGKAKPELLDRGELLWTDKCRGEAAVQEVTLTLPEDAAGSSVSVTLASTGAAKVDSQRKTVTVKVISAVVAKFAADEGRWAALTRTYVEKTVAVTGAGEGNKLTVRKLSGSLPGGVKAVYDAETSSVVFAGTPSRAGTFSATFQVFEELNGKATGGGTFTAVFEVKALADLFPVFDPKQGGATSRTFKDVYFVEPDLKRVTGVLTLTIASNGKLSAKYRCSEGDLAFSATGWDSWDEESGTLKAALTNRKPAYAQYWIYVTQLADGAVEAEVHDGRYPTVYFTRRLTAADIRGAANPATDWRGQYTLAMPVVEYRPASDYDIAYTAAAAGNPVFTLKMTSKSAIKSGTFTWSGFLPNGKSVSGSAVIGADGKAATLPIFFRNSTEIFAALVSVAGGAADDYEKTKGGDYGFGLRAITASQSALGWWEHSDARTANLSFAWTYDAYGSYYAADADLGALLEKSGVAKDVVFTADMTKAPASEVYGPVLQAVAVPMEAGAGSFKSDAKDVKIALARGTGLVSGTVMLPFEGKTVKAGYRAVVLPGWTGCGCHDEGVDLPLLLGSAWFDDKVYYTDPSSQKTKALGVSRGCEVSCETIVPGLE